MHLNIERYMNDVILPGGIVKFDQVITMSGDTVDNDPPVFIPDFEIKDDGSIQIFKKGAYVFRFETTQMTGLSADGNYFTLMYKKYDPNDPSIYQWVPFEDEGDDEPLSTDAKSITLMIIDVDDSERPFTIALMNTTSTNVKLTPYDHTKASLLIFGVPPLEEPDKTDIEQFCLELDAYENNSVIADLTPRIIRLEKMKKWQDETLQELEEALNGEDGFKKLYADYFRPKDYTAYPSAIFGGVSLCSIVAGKYAYNFWASGELTVNVNPSAHGEKVMLVPASNCEPLQRYQGEPCICPCLCKSDTLNINQWLPIYFDNTGVYFMNPPANCLVMGVTLNFTQALILA